MNHLFQRKNTSVKRMKRGRTDPRPPQSRLRTVYIDPHAHDHAPQSLPDHAFGQDPADFIWPAVDIVGPFQIKGEIAFRSLTERFQHGQRCRGRRQKERLPDLFDHPGYIEILASRGEPGTAETAASCRLFLRPDERSVRQFVEVVGGVPVRGVYRIQKKNVVREWIGHFLSAHSSTAMPIAYARSWLMETWIPVMPSRRAVSAVAA